MSKAKFKESQTVLQWHSAEEVPPMHSVQYAGESWMQSQTLLLVNQTGKMALGYCEQGEDGHTHFEVGVSSETLRNIHLWAIIKPPKTP